MDVHLPKPLHGWREFVGEVGIIVLGVLIALGAQQLVTYLSDRAELHEAEQAMIAELRDDDLPQAYTRAAIFGCLAAQLDQLRDAVSSADRAKVSQLASNFNPVYRTWDQQAWQAAVGSQVLVHAGARRMFGWSTAYIAIPWLAEDAKAEHRELPKLWADLSGNAQLSAAQQDRLYEVIATLRDYNRQMSGSSLVLVRLAGDAGLTLTPAQKAAILSEARRQYGDCVKEPSPERLPMQKQLSNATDAVFGANR